MKRFFLKKLSKSVSHELTKRFQIVIQSCLFPLFYETVMSHLSIGLWCVTEVGCKGYQQHPAQWLDWGKDTSNTQLSGWTGESSKARPKTKCAPRKVTVTVGSILPA